MLFLLLLCHVNAGMQSPSQTTHSFQRNDQKPEDNAIISHFRLIYADLKKRMLYLTQSIRRLHKLRPNEHSPRPKGFDVTHKKCTENIGICRNALKRLKGLLTQLPTSDTKLNGKYQQNIARNEKLLENLEESFNAVPFI